MLDDGFKDELTEIVRHCPRGRQTMLFSASMTDDVCCCSALVSRDAHTNLLNVVTAVHPILHRGVNAQVDELVRLSLNSPVRVWVDRSNDLANNLVQEFVRVRTDNMTEREAVVLGKTAAETARPSVSTDKSSVVFAFLGLGSLALCKRTFKTKVIIFVSAKKEAHRMRIILGLGGLSAAELHGDLNQREVRMAVVAVGN